MKHTLGKYQISNQLDTATATPLSIRQDPELARFADSLRTLEHRLRTHPPEAPAPPPWLHAAIMNQVRHEAAARRTRPPFRARRAWWGGAVAAFVLAGIVAAWLLPAASRETSPLWSANQADADHLVRVAASQSASALMEPIASELGNLSKDIERTKEFLLASLP